MKKTTMQTIATYIQNVPELSAEYEELMHELAKNAKKAQANRELYDAAREVVMAKLAELSTPVTAGELFIECEDELPEGFSRSKLQYALANYWSDAVTTYETAGANMYAIEN